MSKDKRKSIHRNIKDIPSYKLGEEDKMYRPVKQFNDDVQLQRTSVSIQMRKQRQNKMQVIHNDGKHLHVIELSKSQAVCYDAIQRYYNNEENKPLATTSVYEVFYPRTIDSLIKKNLLEDKDGKITISKNTFNRKTHK